jgi:hypothetical protein
MEPWGDDWRQTSQIMSILYAHKGIKAEPDGLIPRQRKQYESAIHLGRKLWVGFQALAAAMKGRKGDG